MLQQSGVNLEKTAILAIDPLEAPPCKKNIFLLEISNMTHYGSCYCFQRYFIKNTKRAKKIFGANFGGILTLLGKVRAKVIVEILKLKMVLLLKVTFIEEMFFISSKNVIAFRRYCRFCEKYIAETAGSGNILMKQLSVIPSFLFLLYKLNMHALLQTNYK